MSQLSSIIPAFLCHSEDDTPIPTWEQITRKVNTVDTNDSLVGAHVRRIVSGGDDEEVAVETWNGWPGNCKRSVAILVDKIYNEGWLDLVGGLKGPPWDGGFFFWPRASDQDLALVLNSKTGKKGSYRTGSLTNGLASYFSQWNHRAWTRSWMETDSPVAALHIGTFADGSAEVHLDVFNPLFVVGADRSDISTLPLIGRYNRKMFRLHRRWEGPKYAALTRTSANFYHLMQPSVPLSF
ncbi:MAG: hypothetical protein WAV20_07000 [Blastocatellia bacterium]